MIGKIGNLPINYVNITDYSTSEMLLLKIKCVDAHLVPIFWVKYPFGPYN